MLISKSEREKFGHWVRKLRKTGTPKKDIKRIIKNNPSFAK